MHACVVVWKELEDLEFEGAYYTLKVAKMSSGVKGKARAVTRLRTKVAVKECGSVTSLLGP